MADESSERIERLETATRRLLADSADLREELRALRAIVAPGTVPPLHPVPRAIDFIQRVLDPPRSQADPRPAAARIPRRAVPQRPGILPAGMSFEDFIGRYGAMALAALAIMSGVGLFLSWAIAQNLIGPAVRVSAGFAAAAALAALGWRLRTRNARTFGNTLMGIALAVVHVVAWGAGPGLGVMPNWLALSIAAAASVALALLAWRSAEESLFVVGVGGALVAPFVTTPGRGNGEALLVFGWVVLTTALWGMRSRSWRTARWLLGAAGVAYAAAAMTAAWSADGIFSKEAPAVFALACAWGALVLGGRQHGPGLVRAYLFGGIPPLFWNWDADGVFLSHLVLAAAGTLTLLFAVHRTEEEGTSWIAGALLLPIGFLAAALAPLDDVSSSAGALVALGWAVAAAVTGWFADGRRREILWVVAAITSGTAIVLALLERDIAMIAALSAHGAAVSYIMRRERAGALLVPAMAAFALAMIALWVQFDLRPPYAYTPFLTSASLGALAVTIGVFAVGWNVARTEWKGGRLPPRERSAAEGLGVAAAFVWGHVELAEAFSPDLATFLLIIYYAACGVAAIFIGRRSSLSDVRRIGLGLAIFAALKAVAQGYALATIGLRVGSFLLVGIFLLAVAYWYRAAGDLAPVREPEVP